MPDEAPKQPSLIERLGPAGPLGLLSVAGPPLGLYLLFRYRAEVATWLESQQSLGVALYIAGFVILAGLALLPTHIQCVLAGYVFHWTVAVPAVLSGILGAAVIGYQIARRASGERVLKIIEEKPRWRAVRDALVGVDSQGHGFWRTAGIVALVRVPPNSPFALTNLVMASVRVPRLAFLLGTVVGIAPRTLLAVYIGAGLQALSAEELKKSGAMFWAGLVMTAVVFVVVVVVAQRAVAHMTKAPGSSEHIV
jgi:uncharacterized membrane protein YdjX (TVP38/TMEM64 family)